MADNRADRAAEGYSTNASASGTLGGYKDSISTRGCRWVKLGDSNDPYIEPNDPLDPRRYTLPTGRHLTPPRSAQKLARRLSELGLKEKQILPDGACQFRAIGDQMFGDEGLHADVRRRAVEMLRSQSDHFQDFVQDESWVGYLQRMSKSDEWGDNLTLQV